MHRRRASRQPSNEPEPRLRVGFLLARRLTLCAFANFVDVLRLAADEGDRSRRTASCEPLFAIMSTGHEAELHSPAGRARRRGGFLSVAQHRSFRRAAAELGVTPS